MKITIFHHESAPTSAWVYLSTPELGEQLLVLLHGSKKILEADKFGGHNPLQLFVKFNPCFTDDDCQAEIERLYNDIHTELVID